jgi:hypothetical protein
MAVRRVALPGCLCALLFFAASRCGGRTGALEGFGDSSGSASGFLAGSGSAPDTSGSVSGSPSGSGMVGASGVASAGFGESGSVAFSGVFAMSGNGGSSGTIIESSGASSGNVSFSGAFGGSGGVAFSGTFISSGSVSSGVFEGSGSTSGTIFGSSGTTFIGGSGTISPPPIPPPVVAAGCAALCAKEATAMCPSQGSIGSCIDGCRLLLDNPSCAAQTEALFACEPTSTVSCDDSGKASLDDCEIQTLSATACVLEDATDPTLAAPCAKYCAESAAAACPGDDPSSCQATCQVAGNLVPGCDSAWTSYVNCAVGAGMLSCGNGGNAFSPACLIQGLEYLTCTGQGIQGQ